jgi:N-methylhydantoinase B
VQWGRYAVAEASGAVLAVAPDNWTDGCCVLEETRPRDGATVVVRQYLDPVSGRSLYVDVVPEGSVGVIESCPRSWAEAGATAV